MQAACGQVSSSQIYKFKEIFKKKDKIKLKALPEEERWKVSYIKELTHVKQNKSCIFNEQGEDFFTRKEIDFLLSDLATS